MDDGINLAALMAADLPEPQFLISGLLLLGLSVLAARPKAGKSWLALLWAIAVSNGGKLGAFECRKVPVLYLAREDTRHRFRERAAKLLAATGFRANEHLDIRFVCPRASDGGLALIAEWYSAHPGGLVIVDTLAKFRDVGGRSSAYQDDYAAVGNLKALADEYSGAVLLIHHTRKGAADDPFDEVSGTLGINGAADSTFVLDRNRGEGSASLYVTGRDIAEQTFALTWEAASCLWTIAAPADGITRIEKPKPTTRADQCAIWLREFIGSWAWPDSEILDAAKRVGFGEDHVKKAKAMLRGAEPALCSRPRGSGGAWWNWFGTKSEPQPDRPQPGSLLCLSPETPETPGEGTQSIVGQGVLVSGGGEGHSPPETPETPQTQGSYHTFLLPGTNNTPGIESSVGSLGSLGQQRLERHPRLPNTENSSLSSTPPGVSGGESDGVGEWLIQLARAQGTVFTHSPDGIAWTGGALLPAFVRKLEENREQVAAALARELPA